MIATVVITLVAGAVLKLLQPSRPVWVWGELNLRVLAVLLLAVPTWSLRRVLVSPGR